MKFCLVVGGHIRYADSKASDLVLNMCLNFIDICISKCFFFEFCIVFGFISIRWNMKLSLVVGGSLTKTYSFAFCFLIGLILIRWNMKFGLVGEWPPRWPSWTPNKDWIQCASFQSWILKKISKRIYIWFFIFECDWLLNEGIFRGGSFKRLKSIIFYL
jgi:hypothetical protein